ncbi:MAG TPA: hypothetical protein P5572_16570 [Phycisphaerae bacterium]|nr:hypothetical protein [Phycisphaerales bacterium]HRX86639.1 hypothetical protein [Phycisphaerae bacterium]
MLIFGLFGTFSLANQALTVSASPWAARVAQVIAIASVAVFLWPAVKSAFVSGR